jgi:LysM repeat protein
MLRKIIFWVLALGSVASARTTAKTPEAQVMLEALGNDVKSIRSTVSNLATEVRRLQSDVDLLKLGADVMNEERRVRIEKIAEDVLRKNDPADLVDRRVNALSSAFSKEINGLSEKLQNVLNRIIAVLNAQQKVMGATDTFRKQGEGIAYEIKAGETLDGIAAKYRVTREAIRDLNFIIDENRLPVGQMIFIPQGK